MLQMEAGLLGVNRSRDGRLIRVKQPLRNLELFRAQ